MTARNPSPSAPDRLCALLAGPGCLTLPCCFDALSARLIEQAGFPLTFMSGFAVAAARLAVPDTGLITVSEMLDQGRAICQAVSIPVIGDGDTGHGNPVNVLPTPGARQRRNDRFVLQDLQLPRLSAAQKATDHW